MTRKEACLIKIGDKLIVKKTGMEFIVSGITYTDCRNADKTDVIFWDRDGFSYMHKTVALIK